jgi:hypothetical protein
MLKAKGQGPETQHSTGLGKKKIHLDDKGLNKLGVLRHPRTISNIQIPGCFRKRIRKTNEVQGGISKKYRLDK